MGARHSTRHAAFACASVLAASLVASGAAAGDKKPKSKAVNIDDLFGTPPPKPSGLDAMRKATEAVEAKGNETDLTPRASDIDKEAEVTFTGAFAAARIEHDKRLGCRPAGRGRMKLTSWTFDELPARAPQAFEVCVSMSSNAGREMTMSIAIVDSRNQRVARAEDVVNFNGRLKVDHVLEYPAPFFKLPGQYFYVIDLDGKEAARLPLFSVLLSGEAQQPADDGVGSPGALPGTQTP